MKNFYSLLLGGILAFFATDLVAQNTSVSLTDVDGAVGETVCLDFIGENFDSLSGMQFSIAYDTAALEFVSSDAMIAGSDVSVVPDANNPGRLRVSWTLLFSTSGFTSAPGPFDFGDLCFLVKTDDLTTVAITDFPIPIDFANASDEIITDLDLNDGVVNSGMGTTATCSDGIMNGDETGVDCGGSNCAPCMMTGPCGMDTDEVSFCLGDSGSDCAAAGAEVCVPMFIGNFDVLTGLQFALSWDQDILGFARAFSDDALDGGTVFSNPNSGEFRLTWNDPDALGISFPADEVAFTVCFTVIRPEATPIEFFEPAVTLRAFNEIGQTLSDLPFSPGLANGGCGMTSTCNDGIMNGDETGVDCGGSCQPCAMMEDCGTNTADMSLCIGTTCDVAVGAEACVDITVGNFTDITSLDFIITHPAANLTFASITTNPELSDDLQANASTGGTRLLFFQISQEGNTLDNGDVLGTICYTNNSANRSDLNISNLVASNSAGPITEVAGNPGFINGCTTGMPTCNDGMMNGDETGVDCGGSCAPCMTDEGGPDLDCGMETDDLSLCLGVTCMIGVGEEACVDITVGNFTGITSLDFVINHPAANLTFSSISTNPELSDELQANASAGSTRLLFFQISQEGNTLDNGEILGTICYTNNTTSRSDLSISDFVGSDTNGPIGETSSSPGFINECTPPEPTCDDGIMNGDETGVDCGGSCMPCPVRGDLSFQVADAFAPVGTEVCVDVTANGLTDFTNFQLPVTFDETRLAFVSATGNGPFNTLRVNSENNGQARIQWSGDNVDVANGTAIIQLCFNVLEQCTTPVNIETVPGFRLRVLDPAGMSIMPIQITPGTINAGIPCSDTDPPGNVVLEFATASGALGETICLDLNAEDFENLTDLSFSLTYDTDVLTYTEANNFGLPGLSGANVVSVAPGIITFSWESPAAAGASLPDGATVLSLCFTIDRLVSTEVAFADTPELTTARNADGDVVRVVGVDGRVNPDAPVIDGLTFIMGRANGGVGDTVCLPVVGYEMDSLISFQYTIRYDTALVDFVGREPGVDFPFTGNVLIVNPRPGQVRITWNDPDVNGDDNVPDGTQLYGLCFRVKSTETAIIAFSDNPIAIEFLVFPNLEVPATIIDGQINPSDAPSIVDFNVNDPSCSDLSDGSITLAVSGAEPLTFNWSGSNSTTNIANNLAPGDYAVTVTNASGQQDTLSFTLVAPPPFQIGIGAIDPVTCNGDADGSIELVTVGGTMPFLIDWSGTLQDNQLTQNNLDGDDYSVTITDANGCTRRLPIITVSEPDPVLVAGTVTPITGTPGAINVIVEGGTGTYTYAWTGPGGFTADTEDISGLETAGEYCVTATDENGCDGEMCFQLGGIDLEVSTMEEFNAACAGDEGRIVLSLAGGIAPFTISVAPGGTMLTTSETTVELMLPAGEYTITVTDSRNSTDMTTATIMAPEAITVTSSQVSDTEDMGCTGSIALAIAGGTEPYSILWNNMEETSTISMLCADDYSATITDANGCTFETGTITIGRIDEDVVAINNVTCEGSLDGSIDVSITGGVTPYVFSWVRAGSTEEISDTEDLEAVGEGDYTLTVQDATGATLVRNYTIGANAGFTITSVPTTDFNGFGVSCSGGADGGITTTVNATGDFTFEYILNETLVSSDQNLTNAAAGTYTVIVTGDGGCDAQATVVITEPTPLMIVSGVDQITCAGENDGRISVAPTGGAGPLLLEWSTGDGGGVIDGLSPGDYGVTLTDANNCITEESFTIIQPEDLAVTFETTDATDDCNGTIRILPLGGTGDYVFTWPELANQGNNPFAEGLCPGDYTLVVSDANGCQTVTMVATVRDRRFPCLSVREVITPNGDGLNESLVIFCSGDNVASENTLEIYNRWGQLVFETADYDCSEDGGINCFEGRTNGGTLLPEGAYYFVFDFSNPIGERDQLRGAFTLLRD